MPDIATIWNPATGYGDWEVTGGALTSGDDLTTAILLSVFTDRQAEDSDTIPDGTTDRRGWWGDQGQSVPIGSRLWLLDRSKLTNEVASLAYDYIAEALQWIIDDGIAQTINIATEITAPNRLDVAIFIDRGTAINFPIIWQGIS